jgi:hypothetical protein
MTVRGDTPSDAHDNTGGQEPATADARGEENPAADCGQPGRSQRDSDQAFDQLEASLERTERADRTGRIGSARHRAERSWPIPLVFTAAIVLLAFVSAYAGGTFGYRASAQHTDRTLGVLVKDLDQRREAAQQANARRDAQLGELRRLVCVLADHAQPRDQQVQEARARYGCNGGPYPDPFPLAGPSIHPPIAPSPIPSTGGG